jgi:hypothetical protein
MSCDIFQVDIGHSPGIALGELIIDCKVLRIFLEKIAVDAISRVLDLRMLINTSVEH